MESLEQLKDIVKNAPVIATHVDFNGHYWHNSSAFYWLCCDDGSTTSNADIGNHIRKISDIKLIIELMEDKLRLDHLQKCNEIFNKRAGSNYGWRVDWNHNRIAVVDTGLKGVTIRSAIDGHIKATGDL